MLITGFGPFRNFAVNPSGVVASALDPAAVILPVQYGKVELFVRSFKNQPPDRILSIGVAKQLSEPVFELYAHNVIGAEKGAGSRSHSRTVVKTGGPSTVGQTFISPTHLKTNQVPMKLGFDPGTYLCNFILYSWLIRYPSARVGFIHIPPFETMEMDEQVERIRNLIAFAESDLASTESQP